MVEIREYRPNKFHPNVTPRSLGEAGMGDDELNWVRPSWDTDKVYVGDILLWCIGVAVATAAFRLIYKLIGG